MACVQMGGGWSLSQSTTRAFWMGCTLWRGSQKPGGGSHTIKLSRKCRRLVPLRNRTGTYAMDKLPFGPTAPWIKYLTARVGRAAPTRPDAPGPASPAARNMKQTSRPPRKSPNAKADADARGRNGIGVTGNDEKECQSVRGRQAA
jgi:hypothetical protein